MTLLLCRIDKNQKCPLAKRTCEKEYVDDSRGGCMRLNYIAKVVDSDFGVKKSLDSYTESDFEDLSRFSTEYAEDDEIIEIMSGDAHDDTFTEFLLEKVYFYLESYDTLSVKDAALSMATRWLNKIHDIHFGIE